MQGLVHRAVLCWLGADMSKHKVSAVVFLAPKVVMHVDGAMKPCETLPPPLAAEKSWTC